MTAALTVDGVSKSFRLKRSRPTTLKESIIEYLTGRRQGVEVLWALRDVNFTVEQGRALGIIGHNGAGKSTLLRLLCGLGRPTSGRIKHAGYVSGLLELGSGLHLDMTGRENIMTAGILNGLTKRQVRAQSNEIIAFSELEEFIDQPVRTYSNGMYLRLAFSTAIHFDPDVLMIDEVLAVGDSRFQEKCLDRLHAFRKAGKTLVLVSHNMDEIRTLCDEVLVLEEGRVFMQGDPESAINCYHDLMRQRTEKRAAQFAGEGVQINNLVDRGNQLGTQEATIEAVHLLGADSRIIDTIQSGDALRIVLEYRLVKPIPDMALTLGIYTETNVKCFETAILSTKATFGSLEKQGTLNCHLPKLPLLAGRYYINAGFYPTDWSYVYDYHWQMHVLHVLNEDGIPPGLSGVVSVQPMWSVQSP
jgi:lipopolysaccharide transport system ATP-binding protein